eukprot:scaffold21207_cov124-Isochrysis_galbana.AAC.1
MPGAELRRGQRRGEEGGALRRAGERRPSGGRRGGGFPRRPAERAPSLALLEDADAERVDDTAMLVRVDGRCGHLDPACHGCGAPEARPGHQADAAGDGAEWHEVSRAELAGRQARGVLAQPREQRARVACAARSRERQGADGS